MEWFLYDNGLRHESFYDSSQSVETPVSTICTVSVFLQTMISFNIYSGNKDMYIHSHKERKNSLETRTEPAVFSL